MSPMERRTSGYYFTFAFLGMVSAVASASGKNFAHLRVITDQKSFLCNVTKLVFLIWSIFLCEVNLLGQLQRQKRKYFKFSVVFFWWQLAKMFPHKMRTCFSFSFWLCEKKIVAFEFQYFFVAKPPIFCAFDLLMCADLFSSSQLDLFMWPSVFCLQKGNKENTKWKKKACEDRKL